MRLRRSLFFAGSKTAIALGFAVLTSACGSEDAPEGGAPADSAAAPVTPSQPPGSVLESADYVGLEDGNIAFHLHWVDGPVAKDALTGTEPPNLETVRTATGSTFDRVIFRFVGAALPGYEVAWTSAVTEGCAAQAAPPEGAKHLRIRLRPANSTRPVRADVAAGHLALQAAAQTCAQNGALEWHVALKDSAQVRVIELREPPRLVVDVKEPPRPLPTPVPAP